MLFYHFCTHGTAKHVVLNLFFENIKVFLFWLISQLFSNSSTKTENSVYLRRMILREEDERLMETELV